MNETNGAGGDFARERGPAWRRATTRRAHSIDAGAQAGSEAATGTQIWRSATARAPPSVRVRLRSACKLPATLPRVLMCDNSCAASSRSGAFLRLFSLAVRVMPAAMRFCDAFLFRKGLGLRYQGSLRGGGPQNFVASSVFVYLKGYSGFRLVKRF